MSIFDFTVCNSDPRRLAVVTAEEEGSQFRVLINQQEKFSIVKYLVLWRTHEMRWALAP